MTRLIWDEIGHRTYEAGLDRGVFYKEDTTGVVWNGLVSIDESFSDDTSSPVYLDGVKYLDAPSFGDFSAKLSAFTYPDEFLEYEGVSSLGGGLSIDGQRPKLFGLSYRTQVGNDIDGIEHGYKLHILYNLTAIPDSTAFNTITDSSDPIAFQWEITGVPAYALENRPTCHVILDSRYMNTQILTEIEDILYGRGSGSVDTVYDGGDPDDVGTTTLEGGDPDHSDDPPPETILDAGFASSGVGVLSARLPSLEELMNIVFFWDPRFIILHTSTGLNDLTSGAGDLTISNADGVFTLLPSTRLVPTTIDGYYSLT